jgi:hypothetical protein
VLFPFKHFGIHIDFDQDPSWCFRMLVSDLLSFHAVSLLTSAANDLISQRPLSNLTFRHLQRTLSMLNEKLSHPEAYKHDQILYVVGLIASIAVLFGDYTAAGMHARGLSKILRLRVGHQATEQSPAIQLAIIRSVSLV